MRNIVKQAKTKVDALINTMPRARKGSFGMDNIVDLVKYLILLGLLGGIGLELIVDFGDGSTSSTVQEWYNAVVDWFETLRDKTQLLITAAVGVVILAVVFILFSRKRGKAGAF